jgi:hypothetical protein
MPLVPSVRFVVRTFPLLREGWGTPRASEVKGLGLVTRFIDVRERGGPRPRALFVPT